jgi:Tfp pilus assembly protein PilO
MKDWPWYGYVVVAVILFGLFFFFYFKPNNQKLQNLQEEREKVEQEVAKLKVKKEEMDKIEAELKTLDITLKELETVIPKKKETDDILRKIQQLAYDSRIDIKNFEPKREIEKEFYAEWPIPIEITGNYHNLATFFDRLSSFSRLFNIEDFSIKALRKQSDATTISSKFTAKTYLSRDMPPEQEEGPEKPGKKR